MPVNAAPSRVGHFVLKMKVVAWLVLGRPAQAERVLDEMLASRPTDAYALASRSNVRAQRGAFEEAVVDARALVQAHPERSAGDWFNLGYLLEQAGHPAQAEPAFRRAVALDEKLDRAWYGLGLVLVRLGRHEEAVAALERNTKLQPMSPYGWYQLARLHADRQQADEAVKIIRHLKGFEPKVAAQLERETGLAA